MKKVLPIVEGIKNFVSRNEDIERKAKERLAICKECEYNSRKAIETCLVCGCILQLKVRQDSSSCPKQKW